MTVSKTNLINSTKPKFIAQKKQIFTTLRSMSIEQLQELWHCSLQIAEQNYQRLHMDNSATGLAIFTYQGLQFQSLAPTTLSLANLEFLQQHLWILSGAYGVLRPFDAIEPYRLEMKNQLDLGTTNSLYTFWGSKLANTISSQASLDNPAIIVNLASNEYAKSIEKELPAEVIMVTILFVVKRNDKYLQQATIAKKARGRMVNFIAIKQINNLEGLKEFNQLGFLYNENISNDTKMVFVYRGE